MDKVYYNVIMSNVVGYGDETSIDYSNFNTKMLKKILGDYTMLISKYDVYSRGIMNQFLFDVSIVLPQVGFTDVQARRLQMWFDGFNESEIAASEGVSRWVVSKSLHLACDKILNELEQLAE